MIGNLTRGVVGFRNAVEPVKAKADDKQTALTVKYQSFFEKIVHILLPFIEKLKKEK